MKIFHLDREEARFLLRLTLKRLTKMEARGDISSREHTLALGVKVKLQQWIERLEDEAR